MWNRERRSGTLFALTVLMLCTASGSVPAPCSIDTSVDITEGTHLSNGIIYFDGIRYDPSDHYYDNTTNTERGCICKKRICMQKCCPQGQVLRSYDKKCINSSIPFDPPIWDKYKKLEESITHFDFYYVYRTTRCIKNNTYRILISNIMSEYHLRKDGNLYIELPTSIPPWTVRTPDEYCLDTFVTEENGVTKTRLDALVCFASQSEENNYIISITCMLISCFFILLTVGVYSWLPELRNLHGRVLTAYLLSLFVGFTFLATMQLLLTLHQITTDMCLIFTFIIYYALLAAFFWLNVMCFDIWWTFSGKRGLALERLSTRGRFNAYAVYAFGIPTALTVLLMCLEFSGLPLHPYLPLIRHQGCFLFGHSKLLYLYGPIIVLCLANMTFFVLTAIRIARIKQQTAVLQSMESATHDQHQRDKQRLFLYVKLFLVMGINWLLEVASALYPDAKEVWKYTDAYNVLIGFTIFVIFVCKKKIFRLMKKRMFERSQEPMKELQSIRNFNNIRANWRSNGLQRGSLDTIRTVCNDTGSDHSTKF